jgi:hypothetical protein
MRNLSPLVGLMRNMSTEGGATAGNPKLILTGSGLELRLSGREAESPDALRQADRLAELERSLKLLGARIVQVEEQLSSQTAIIDSLRAGVKVNEEVIEALVDSLTMTDDLSFGQPDLTLGPKTLAS